MCVSIKLQFVKNSSYFMSSRNSKSYKISFHKTTIVLLIMSISNGNIIYISIEDFVGISTVVGICLVCHVVLESMSLRRKLGSF